MGWRRDGGRSAGEVGVMVFWRYLIPRSNYKRSLKIAKACPELRSFVDEEARLHLLEYAWIAMVVPFMAIAKTCDGISWALQAAAHSLPFGDTTERRSDNSDAAHKIMSHTEIKERLGEPVEFILRKKAA